MRHRWPTGGDPNERLRAATSICSNPQSSLGKYTATQHAPIPSHYVTCAWTLQHYISPLHHHTTAPSTLSSLPTCKCMAAGTRHLANTCMTSFAQAYRPLPMTTHGRNRPAQRLHTAELSWPVKLHMCTPCLCTQTRCTTATQATVLRQQVPHTVAQHTQHLRATKGTSELREECAIQTS